MIGIRANFHISYHACQAASSIYTVQDIWRKLETLKLHIPCSCLEYFVHFSVQLHKNALIKGVTHSI